MEERIKNVMASVFEIEASEITEESDFDSIEKWESLTHINLIVALEEEFGISIDEDEIVNLISYKQIKDLIEKTTG